MVYVASDPNLQHARRRGPNRAAAVDEVLLNLAHLRDVIVGGHEGFVRQHPVHLHVGVAVDRPAELFHGHRQVLLRRSLRRQRPRVYRTRLIVGPGGFLNPLLNPGELHCCRRRATNQPAYRPKPASGGGKAFARPATALGTFLEWRPLGLLIKHEKVILSRAQPPPNLAARGPPLRPAEISQPTSRRSCSLPLPTLITSCGDHEADGPCDRRYPG
jgi:hypothetical protein